MSETPWTRSDAARTAAFVAVGLVVWMFGWFGVSGQAAFEGQIAPLNLAIVGVVLVGAGYAGWFLAGRRAVGARKRVLLARSTDVAAAAGAVDPDGFVGSERLFHRVECAMSLDRSWAVRPRVDHERAGRRPCGVCRP